MSIWRFIVNDDSLRVADHSLHICASLTEVTFNRQTIRVEGSAWDLSWSHGERECNLRAT